MSLDRRLLKQRFELKYLIYEDTARRIRDYISSFMMLDENCIGKSDNSYAVHSLYIDSDHLQTYWATINGSRNRFKLRIRYYTDDPGKPVFLEIKRRLNSCIKKQRAAVRREHVNGILAGQLPPSEVLASYNPTQAHALQDFCRLVQTVQGRPKAHVAYMREAYLPKVENSARVTMDRMVRTESQRNLELTTTMRKPFDIWEAMVVLELKFTDRFPNWFGDLVREFNLTQSSAAKYAEGLTLLNGWLPGHSCEPRPKPGVHWPCRSARPAALEPKPEGNEFGAFIGNLEFGL